MCLGLHQVAEIHRVIYTTLSNRVKGRKSILDFNTSKQKISIQMENTLVNLINLSSDQSYPFTHSEIEKHANRLLLAKHDNRYEPVGKMFIENFLCCHYKVLHTY